MRVAIIGQGYVGLTIAVDAATAGNTVVGFDVNQGLVDALNSGKSHIEGVASSDLAKWIAAGKYKATTDADANVVKQVHATDKKLLVAGLLTFVVATSAIVLLR